MTKVKTNFSFHKVDFGLDVHKRSWNAAVFLDGVYVRSVHHPPSPKAMCCFYELRKLSLPLFVPQFFGNF